MILISWQKQTESKEKMNLSVSFLSCLATCVFGCSSGGSYDGTTTCGRICVTTEIGPHGSPTGSVGTIGPCFANSTFCPSGSFTIIRNTYSGVNFDCGGCCGCGSFGGCCVNVKTASSNDYFCIQCNN